MDKGNFWRKKIHATNLIVACCVMSLFTAGASGATTKNSSSHTSDFAPRVIVQVPALLPLWRLQADAFKWTSTTLVRGEAGNSNNSTTTSTGGSPSPNPGTTHSTGTTTTTSPTSSTNTSLQLGAYVGPADPSGIKTFELATGEKLTLASDYLPSNDGWAGMDGADGNLNWLTGAWQSSGFTLSLGVPMIPTNGQGMPEGTLAQGANGSYNAYFVSLAKSLVAAGEGNSYLRLGWEFDGDWFSWQALTPAAETSYAMYFQQIVTAMRTVAGEDFQFVWNPDASAFASTEYSLAAAYPGNSYVDVIGVDLYDMSWVNPLTPLNVWNNMTLPALTAAENFAKSEGKPLAICEWGVLIRGQHGLRDDPLYVNDMAAWMKNRSNNVAYESYFDGNTQSGVQDQDQNLTDGLFPNSRAALGADFH
jgi:hypothetical protein